MVIPRENAWDIMNRLGEIGVMHLEEMNIAEGANPFARPFARYIKRCEEMEIKIKHLDGTMKKMNLPIPA